MHRSPTWPQQARQRILPSTPLHVIEGGRMFSGHRTRTELLDAPWLAGLLAAGALVLFGLTFSASSARASFPGANGQIAFTRCVDGVKCEVGEIWTMSPDGTGQARLFADPGYWDDDPSYSADGRMLLFQRCPTQGNVLCGIAAVDAHGQGVRDLTKPAKPIVDDYAAYSPDGGKVVFQRNDGNTTQIWIMNPDGTNPHKLTSAESNYRPEFSPDGTQIVFNRAHSGSSHIWLMNADGSNQHPVTSAANRIDHDASYSPDGTQIAFTGCETAGACAAVWVVNVDGSGARRLTLPAIEDREPAFSPDGRHIAFERRLPDGTTRLYSVAVSGGQPTQISSGYDWASAWGRVPTPSIDSAPTIAGTPRAGHAVTATAGHTSWGGSTSFQWLRCAGSCAVIPGATSATYKPTNADVGARLRVRQIQSSAGGTSTADSAALGPVAAEPGARIARKVTLARTLLLARLSCPATQSVVCNVALTVRAATGKRHAARVGSARFSIPAGKTAKATVRLSKRAAALIAGARKFRVSAALVTRDDAGNTTKSKANLALKRH
jgi:Tol biopolymer transport system component